MTGKTTNTRVFDCLHARYMRKNSANIVAKKINQKKTGKIAC